MKRLGKATDSEMEVMKVIWENQRPLTPKEVTDKLSYRNWKYNTVNTFLTRLAEKGLLECEKDKVNHYIPLVTQEEYKRFETREFLDTVHHGSLRSMLASLCDQNISDEKLNELLEELERD